MGVSSAVPGTADRFVDPHPARSAIVSVRRSDFGARPLSISNVVDEPMSEDERAIAHASESAKSALVVRHDDEYCFVIGMYDGRSAVTLVQARLGGAPPTRRVEILRERTASR